MGALTGTTVIDLSRLAPGPYCSMLLGDMGADVIRVDPIGGAGGMPNSPLDRSKRSITLNLKVPEAQDVLHRLVERADVFLEGFRPGVCDRLGAGWQQLSALNPRLVYCSITGWGQTGPLAMTAGHDIDYIAIAGALEPVGRQGERPVPALNLLGDFAGGGLMAAWGIACALLERQRSGKGQYVDAAMVDGAASLMSMHYGFHSMGVPVGRGQGLLDTGAPFYEVYETKDGKYLGVGCIEPQFWTAFWERLCIDEDVVQMDRSSWPRTKQLIADRIRDKTRAEWEEIYEGTDACTYPALSLAEALTHPANTERGVFVEVDGAMQPAPAPRLSRTPGRVQSGSPAAGAHSNDVFAEIGLSEEDIELLNKAGATG